MKVFKAIIPLQEYLNTLRYNGKSIGFVPTMGALHEGHIALIKRAKQENEIVVCSIFVNPKQFNNPSDLEKYPRTLEADMQMLEKGGCDVLFAPEVKEMYETDLAKVLSNKAENEIQNVSLGVMGKVMEAAFRPGHFEGVMLVVYRLFDIVKAQRAYFGEKDFQQLAIIQQMVKQLQLPVAVIPCPTLRETDGLAMSSRNTRLTHEQRKEAPAIYAALQWIKNNYEKITVQELKQGFTKMVEAEKSMKVEYIELSRTDNLQAVTTIASLPIVVCTAVKCGEVRLIDNIVLS